MELDINKIIVHKDHGLCKIVGKEYMSFVSKNYYIMNPLSTPNMKVMVPEDKTKEFCRDVLTREQCLHIVDSIKNLSDDYIVDNKKRKEEYTKLLHSENLLDIAQLLKYLWTMFENKRANNKAIGSIDTSIFNEAKTKLYSEIQYVLEIKDEDGVIEFIKSRL
jgi:RNA polymerase-interacting CarD/CdnL/TRCF family regulator